MPEEMEKGSKKFRATPSDRAAKKLSDGAASRAVTNCRMARPDPPDPLSSC